MVGVWWWLKRERVWHSLRGAHVALEGAPKAHACSKLTVNGAWCLIGEISYFSCRLEIKLMSAARVKREQRSGCTFVTLVVHMRNIFVLQLPTIDP